MKQRVDLYDRPLSRYSAYNSYIANDHSEVSDFLSTFAMTIDKSLYINQSTMFGNTPLHYCSITDNLRIARLLLEYGASLSPNKAGHSPISIIELHREKFTSLVYRTLYCSEQVAKNDFFPAFPDFDE